MDEEAFDPPARIVATGIVGNENLFRRDLPAKSEGAWMGAGRGHFSGLRGVCAAFMVLTIGLAFTACSASTRYAGISLIPGAADPELQALARRAEAGDRNSQLELAIRFEEGLGVVRDRAAAERLYSRVLLSGCPGRPLATVNAAGGVRMQPSPTWDCDMKRRARERLIALGQVGQSR